MLAPRILLPMVVAVVALSAAACSSSSSGPGTGGDGTGDGAGAGAGTSGTTSPPKVPPKGDPADPDPIDPTNDPAAKACTGTPGELDALSAKKLTVGDDVPLCRFDGSVLMIVNVASHCGNTPQYAPLQALYDKYRAQGFYILGFPSPQFGGQEFGTDQEVSTFCTNEYHITFPMFAIGDVNGAAQQPVYKWIHAQPGYERDIQWNFEKFLLDRHGKIVKRIENGTPPNDPTVIAAVEAELAKK
jgi:glutathione peroxidase